MAKPKAFILRWDKEREKAFTDALDNSGFFYRRGSFLFDSRNAPHIASGRRSVNAVTLQDRLNVADVELLYERWVGIASMTHAFSSLYRQEQQSG